MEAEQERKELAKQVLKQQITRRLTKNSQAMRGTECESSQMQMSEGSAFGRNSPIKGERGVLGSVNGDSRNEIYGSQERLRDKESQGFSSVMGHQGLSVINENSQNQKFNSPRRPTLIKDATFTDTLEERSITSTPDSMTNSPNSRAKPPKFATLNKNYNTSFQLSQKTNVQQGGQYGH